jgi:peptidylprolyl isomerase
MKILLKIDDEIITTDYFIKFLKFSNEFPGLVEKLIRNKVTVRDAQKRGITVSNEEVQAAADDFRRCIGLHRAKETYEWMDEIGITADDFEGFITEHLYKKKMMDTLATDESIEAYFRLNSPEFDTADIRHIVVENEDQAKEILALLEDEPESFGELAGEYSLDEETKDAEGQIRGIRRGILPDEIDAKVFNAEAGTLIGPFQIGDESFYEIIQVMSVNSAKAEDSAVKEKITEAIYEEWIQERMKEHRVRLSV